jgi:alpha-glucosidase
VNTNPAARVPLALPEKPEISTLPVFVRGGAIIPMQPLVQSTNETPQGPLTLRVYAGELCSGSLYLDDGKTLAYRHGEFLRMQFSCDRSSGHLHVHVGRHEGSYPAWWKEIRLEIYGATGSTALVDGREVSVARSGNQLSLTIPDSGQGVDVRLQ